MGRSCANTACRRTIAAAAEDMLRVAADAATAAAPAAAPAAAAPAAAAPAAAAAALSLLGRAGWSTP